MNIFERAARKKLEFTTPQGVLTTYDLFDLPLTARSPNKANLDSMAREVARELRGLTEDSFVDVKPDPRKADLELRLEILKHVIEAQKSKAAAAEKAEQTKQQIARLERQLAIKDDEKLAAASREDIEAQLKALKNQEQEAA